MIGFAKTLVLGLIAALVGSFLQHRSWKQRNIEEILQRERSESTEVVKHLSHAIDKRLDAQSRFLTSVNSQNATSEDFAKFNEALREWMHEFSSFKSQIFLFFGSDEVREFEYKVHQLLYETASVIGRTYKLGYVNLSRPHQEEHKRVSKKMNFTRVVAYKFLNRLNERISHDEIGRSQYVNDIHQQNLKYVSTFYLLQRLFAINS